ncbi:MAG: hypothetical protein KBC95_03425 [Candidatus Peribacteraceae bacterium]|nr:hypothetical protein [Candidatus Peribacteraceae bacterium]
MRLPPALVVVLFLAACSSAPSQPTEIPPAPIVNSGANVPRDVSEDGLGAPQTSTAAVLVINKGIGTGAWMDDSGMVMWSSSWSSMSSWSSSSMMMGSGSSLSASGVVVSSLSSSAMSSSSRSGSGIMVIGSGSVVGSGTVAAPSSSSASRSASGVVISSSQSSSTMASASSSSMTSSAVSSVLWEDDEPTVPGSTTGGGVQPRRAANNLVITLETDYEVIPPGGLMQVSIPVRNFSAGPAEGFLVEAQVPEGVTITDAILGEIDGRSVRWRFNQLLQNQMYTLHFVVRTPRGVPNQTVLPFSARVSGGNLAGTAMVTTNVTVVTDMPQTGVDMGATLLEGARSTASAGQRTVLLVAGLTALALMAGLVAGRVIASQRA